MTGGKLFPGIPISKIKEVHVPVLLMTGGKSQEFLQLIDIELARLLPDSQSVVFEDSGHQMWMQHPKEARDDADAFFRKHP